MTKGTYSHSNRHRIHEHDNVPLLEARAEILKLKRENDELKECPYGKHRDTDYHDRLEREVTSLKREVILLETQNTNLTHDLNSSHRQIHDLRAENEQLRQAIAVLNDEPTNSL